MLSLVANYGETDSDDSNDDDDVIPKVAEPPTTAKSSTQPSTSQQAETDPNQGIFSVLPAPLKADKSKKKKKGKKKKKKKKKRKRETESQQGGTKKKKVEIEQTTPTANPSSISQHAIFSMLPAPTQSGNQARTLGGGGGSRLDLGTSKTSSNTNHNRVPQQPEAQQNQQHQQDTQPEFAVPVLPKPKPPRYGRTLPSKNELMASFSIGPSTAPEATHEETSQSYSNDYVPNYDYQPEVGPQRRSKNDTSYIDTNDPTLSKYAMPDRSFGLGLAENPDIIEISANSLRDNTWRENVNLRKEQHQKAALLAPIQSTKDASTLLQQTPTRYQKRRHHVTALAVESQEAELDLLERQATAFKKRSDSKGKYGW